MNRINNTTNALKFTDEVYTCKEELEKISHLIDIF